MTRFRPPCSPVNAPQIPIPTARAAQARGAPSPTRGIFGSFCPFESSFWLKCALERVDASLARTPPSPRA